MTDTATLDRPCIWYACLDQAAAGRLFCDRHEKLTPPELWHWWPIPEDSPYHDLTGATEDDSRL